MSAAGDSTSQRGEIRVHLFGRTDVGQVREHNEDNFLVADLTRKSRSLKEEDRVQVVGRCGTLLGVCDGMGGAAAGEVASQMAVDVIYGKLTSAEAPADNTEIARRLVESVEEAGTKIFEAARADRTRRGMGTTSTVAVLMDSRLFVAQVGDSRAYVLRGDRLVQVTRDQSLVNQLIEAGQLTEEEAETFEHNNIILQALGTADTVQVDLTYVDLRRGDMLVMCSDGLSGMVRADEIRQVLMEVQDPLQACKVLTDRANAAGGHDNITVIVARFDGEGLLPLDPKEEPLAYRKAALPDLAGAEPAKPEPADRISVQIRAGSPDMLQQAKKLRVAHTMVGVVSPLEGAGDGPAEIRYSLTDEPIDIPTSGAPPRIVGALVVTALVAFVALGFFLLR